MPSPHLKGFLIALAVLTVFHAIASFTAYRFFAVRRELPVTSTPIETTTPAEQAAGQTSFRVEMRRTEIATPLPVSFYIVGGFAGLGVAAILGLFTYLRSS